MPRQDVTDEVIYLRAAGLDLGKRFLIACVRIPSSRRPGTWSLETERFGTTVREARRLQAWLLERQVEVVALEATSDYWRGVYYTLQEAQLNLMLVNPAHLRGIRGRKSDPSDAAFLARAAASGMVLGSFVPGRQIRQLRELTRRRAELVVMRGEEIQRLEKALEETGMKLSSVLSDLTGVSSRRILDALVAGERDPQVLAELVVAKVRHKIPTLVEALDATFTDHHAWMCAHYLRHLDRLAADITDLDAQIAAMTTEHDLDLANLDTIPGIARTAAEVILAETGGDMNQFPTAGHLASWIGVCPGMNESAGVQISAQTRKGNSHLKRVLGTAAMAAVRKTDSYHAVFYRRVATRRGKQRALVAVMHKLAVAIWHILHRKTAFHDLGADHFTRRDPARAMKRMTREANSLGFTVRFDPIA